MHRKPISSTMPPPTEQWEYRRLRLDTNEGLSDLNRLGKRGWELVSVCVQNTLHFGYMKRRLSDIKER